MRFVHFAVAMLVAAGFVSTGNSAVCTISDPLNPVLISRFTSAQVVVNGNVSAGEWNSAGFLPDNPGLAGATYAQWRNNLVYDSWNYSGRFSFLLHNIEQNTTFGNGVLGTDPAFNVFDIFLPGDAVNKYLEVNVRYDGFTVDKYDTLGNIVDTRVFQYGVDLAPEQTASYDWDNYFGIYARGGFNNSAFQQGLALAVDNDNQVFELVFRDTLAGALPPVRRNLKDPDQLNNWEVVEYLDVTVCTVPEPTSCAIFGLGALGAFARARLRRKKSDQAKCSS